jgi:hypothetical protein
LVATLVGRGADLAEASLTLDGADPGAQIDKPDARSWTIHAVPSPPHGTHTARVQVRDTTGALGGFTWQFTVGEPEPTATPAEATAEPKPTDQPADDGRDDDSRRGRNNRDTNDRESGGEH